MRKICPKCDGKGYHSEEVLPLFFKLLFAVPTIGASFIDKDVECKVCEGKGFIE
jgi:hypothetical protein